MLCRRCGMDSSTTDVCEWCKKPMLAPGATVTEADQARGGPQAAAEAAAEEQAGQPEEPEASPVAPEAEAPSEPSPDQQPAAPEEAVPDVLRPLGQEVGPTPGRGPAAPTHGIAKEATQTSIDVANYLPGDQSLFRPIERPSYAGTPDGIGALEGRRGVRTARQAINPIPDNIRLIRSLIAGVLIAMVLAIVQFAVVHRVPPNLYFLNLGRSESFATAILWGLSSGILLGGGLGALLVQFKRGPFLGLLAGLLLGSLGLQNGYYGIASGVLIGIVVGRIATVGYRRPMGV